MVEKNKSDNMQDVRLARFSVKKLFDEYDYSIDFRLNQHVTAIIAPNGTGKTLCLRMIHGLFEQRWTIFSDTIFNKASYFFTNGAEIHVEKIEAQASNDELVVPATFRVRVCPVGDANEITWVPRFGDIKRVIQVERYVPFITRYGPNRWRHDRTGEVYTLSQVLDIYGHLLPESVRSTIYGKKPDYLDDIVRKIDCRLIETQRLLVLRGETEGAIYNSSGRPVSNLAISRKAQALKDIISGELNAYASLSQTLDRSFPKRVIQKQSALNLEDLRARLSNLDDKRRELMDAGILDSEVDDPVFLPQGALDPAISRVLSVYADDSSKKLESLSGILSKIKLFKELIDNRFITKDVQISKKTGFDVTFRDNDVPLERLSSGEQHQLVLFFELLFEIKQNSLILIDEPELSLHIAWQKKFIADLMKIIKLNKFDVLLATHSPQLIGRWNDLVVELGDVYEGLGPEEYEFEGNLNIMEDK